MKFTIFPKTQLLPKNTIVEELAGMVTTFYHLSLPWDLKGRQAGPGATAVRWPSHGQGRRDGAGTVPGRCRDGAGTVQMPSYQGVNDY